MEKLSNKLHRVNLIWFRASFSPESLQTEPFLISMPSKIRVVTEGLQKESVSFFRSKCVFLFAKLPFCTIIDYRTHGIYAHPIMFIHMLFDDQFCKVWALCRGRLGAPLSPQIPPMFPHDLIFHVPAFSAPSCMLFFVAWFPHTGGWFPRGKKFVWKCFVKESHEIIF